SSSVCRVPWPWGERARARRGGARRRRSPEGGAAVGGLPAAGGPHAADTEVVAGDGRAAAGVTRAPNCERPGGTLRRRGGAGSGYGPRIAASAPGDSASERDRLPRRTLPPHLQVGGVPVRRDLLLGLFQAQSSPAHCEVQERLEHILLASSRLRRIRFRPQVPIGVRAA